MSYWQRERAEFFAHVKFESETFNYQLNHGGHRNFR